ncbi:MAG: RNA-binding protein [Elusimicrobia bacterium]|nr:RNA-binding protein [Elusimicrobiota bacterium]
MADDKNKVFVAGLPWETNQHELYELVKPCGRIVEAKIILDRGTGKSKGFAFVEMSSAREAEAVIQRLNGSELGGRKLFATEFKAKGQPGGSAPRAPAAAAHSPSAPRATFGPPGGIERRSGQDRRKNPGFGGPAPERREFKKPWEKKPWSKDKPGSGSGKPWEKKPWDKDRKPSFGDRKPWRKDKGPGGKKPWGKKPFGSRRP